METILALSMSFPDAMSVITLAILSHMVVLSLQNNVTLSASVRNLCDDSVCP